MYRKRGCLSFSKSVGVKRISDEIYLSLSYDSHWLIKRCVSQVESVILMVIIIGFFSVAMLLIRYLTETYSIVGQRQIKMTQKHRVLYMFHSQRNIYETKSQKHVLQFHFFIISYISIYIFVKNQINLSKIASFNTCVFSYII